MTGSDRLDEASQTEVGVDRADDCFFFLFGLMRSVWTRE